MKTGTLHIRIDQELLAAVNQAAEADTRTLTSFVEKWLKHGIAATPQKRERRRSDAKAGV